MGETVEIDLFLPVLNSDLRDSLKLSQSPSFILHQPSFPIWTTYMRIMIHNLFLDKYALHIIDDEIE